MSTPTGDVAISKTQRWLDLIAFLVARRFPVPVDEVMEGVQAYREKYRSASEKDRAALHRMFERDKDELRAAGIPIATVEYTIEGQPEKAVGYRLDAKDFYLPYLRILQDDDAAADSSARQPTSAPGAGAAPAPERGGASPRGARTLDLTPEDARAAIDGLRRVASLPGSPFGEEARSALTKLTFDLAPGAVREAPVLFAESPEAERTRETLRLLTDALRRRARVRFRYHGIHRGEATDRDVAPHGLLYQHGHWYLIGPDATRDGDVRVFRLGRMEAVEAGADHGYELDPDFQLGRYIRRQPWELGDDAPLDADVRFEFPTSLWADRNGYGRMVEARAGGAVVRRFEVRQADPFLRWLQSLAGDAVVTSPPELRQAQVEMARATLARYGEGHG